jgi:hypothetical protein
MRLRYLDWDSLEYHTGTFGREGTKRCQKVADENSGECVRANLPEVFHTRDDGRVSSVENDLGPRGHHPRRNLSVCLDQPVAVAVVNVPGEASVLAKLLRDE